MNTNQPKHQISPVAWVPTVYFAMGMPFVVLNMVTALMFKGLGISDAYVSMDDQAVVESVPGNVQDQKVLCRTDAVLFRYLFRVGGIVFAIAELLCDIHCPIGGDCL